MKESITKFDLESAFKALDEIEIPRAGRVRANKPALTEIFSRKSKFDALMEEYYDIGSSEGLEDAKVLLHEDDEEMREYMNKWDGKVFIDLLNANKNSKTK